MSIQSLEDRYIARVSFDLALRAKMGEFDIDHGLSRIDITHLRAPITYKLLQRTSQFIHIGVTDSGFRILFPPTAARTRVAVIVSMLLLMVVSAMAMVMSAVVPVVVAVSSVAPNMCVMEGIVRVGLLKSGRGVPRVLHDREII